MKRRWVHPPLNSGGMLAVLLCLICFHASYVYEQIPDTIRLVFALLGAMAGGWIWTSFKTYGFIIRRP